MEFTVQHLPWFMGQALCQTSHFDTGTGTVIVEADLNQKPRIWTRSHLLTLGD